MLAQRKISVEELARRRNISPARARAELRPLVRQGWVGLVGDVVQLSEPGLERARELDRNYHLWELFLTHEVHLPADHTARDAEDIEHLLTPELVRELQLRYARAALEPGDKDT
jgi:manganese/zinc/iron transport system permease protein